MTSSRAPSPWKTYSLPPHPLGEFFLAASGIGLQLNALYRTQRHRQLEPDSFYFSRPISGSPPPSPVYFGDMIWGTILFPILISIVRNNGIIMHTLHTNASRAASCHLPIFDLRLPNPNTFMRSPALTYTILLCHLYYTVLPVITGLP
jgi:hypothetical protein